MCLKCLHFYRRMPLRAALAIMRADNRYRAKELEAKSRKG
jgi:hypothetical protein